VHPMDRRILENDTGLRHPHIRGIFRLTVAISLFWSLALVSLSSVSSSPALAGRSPSSDPFAVFTFGRAYAQILPYTVVLRSDGAVVATSYTKRLVHLHVVSKYTIAQLRQMAQREGFRSWSYTIVHKTPSSVEAPEVFIRFDGQEVDTVPVHNRRTHAFYRLLGGLMKASRLRFCKLPYKAIPTPCALVSR